MHLYLVYQTLNILFRVVTWSSSILVEGGVMWYGSTVSFSTSSKLFNGELGSWLDWVSCIQPLPPLSFVQEYRSWSILLSNPPLCGTTHDSSNPIKLQPNGSKTTNLSLRQRFFLSLVMNLFFVRSPWSMAPSCAPYWHDSHVFCCSVGLMFYLLKDPQCIEV